MCGRLLSHIALRSLKLPLFLVVACSATLHAATVVWEDTGTDFEVGGNWVGDSVPTNDTTTDTAQFDDSSISNQPQLTASRSVQGLDFQTAGWTLSGGALTLTVGTVGIDSIGAGTNTLSDTSTGNLIFDLAGSSTWTIGSGNTLALSGLAKISSSSTEHVTKEGDGTLDLTGAHTTHADNWDGNLTINNGIVIFDAAGGNDLPDGTITVNSGGTLQVQDEGGGSNAYTGNLTIAGTGEGGIGAITTNQTGDPLNGSLTVDAAGALIRYTYTGGDIWNNENSGETYTLNGDLTLQTTDAGSTLNESFNGATLTGSGNVIFDLENDGTLGSGLTTTGWTGKYNIIDGTLKFRGSNTVADTIDFDIDDGGTADFEFYTETFDQLEIEGGGTLKNSSFNALIISGDITVAGGSSTTAVIDNSDSNGGDIELAGNSTSTTISVASGKTLQINGDLHDALITKTGDGTLELGDGSDSRSNLFTGDLTISGGTVKLNKNDAVNALAGGADVIINSGGTLLLAQNNQINTSVGITLAGGTFDVDGYNEELGTLTLSANSVIDFGTGIADIDFSSTNIDTVLGSSTLSVWNWSGTANTAGSAGVDDRLIFGGSTFTKTNQVIFYSDAGSTVIGNGVMVGNELVSNGTPPIPEPSTYATAVLLVMAAGFWERRRRRAAQVASAASAQ